MTRRRAFELHLLTLFGSILVAAVVGIVAVWTESERLGGTAGIFGGLAAIAATLCMIWIDGAPKPEPRLSRAARRRLREETERIDLDARIRRMEREAGL